MNVWNLAPFVVILRLQVFTFTLRSLYILADYFETGTSFQAIHYLFDKKRFGFGGPSRSIWTATWVCRYNLVPKSTQGCISCWWSCPHEYIREWCLWFHPFPFHSFTWISTHQNHRYICCFNILSMELESIYQCEKLNWRVDVELDFHPKLTCLKNFIRSFFTCWTNHTLTWTNN